MSYLGWFYNHSFSMETWFRAAAPAFLAADRFYSFKEFNPLNSNQTLTMKLLLHDDDSIALT